MATKTDSILSYLPPTFRAVPRPTALYAVADSAGEQLLQAENSLGAVMLSHWVDHADLGAEFITDLACFAALYGLAPRGGVHDVARFQTPTCLPFSADETVEEFREHLKRYVLTFLDGTVTVQGILRIVAEALGIHIADSYGDMDTWWTRGNDALVTQERRGDDASEQLFGTGTLTARGKPETRAQVAPAPDFTAGTLPVGARLRIKVDNAGPVDVDLSSYSRAALDGIVSAINRKFPEPIAANRDGLLHLASPTIGAGSRLEVIDVDVDAAPALLGLAPRIYRGTPVQAATVVGSVALSGKIDLSEHRYLRLTIDDKHLAEIDCAGSDPAATTLPEIVSAVNKALRLKAASAEGDFLKLTSPTKGPASSIAIEAAAAQDSKNSVLGPGVTFSISGQAAQRAEISREFDVLLGATVDLSSSSRLRLAIDGGPPVIVDCAGATPKTTDIIEIESAINKAMGANIASIEVSADDPDLAIFHLKSPKTGPLSQISFLPLPENEATEPIFGIRPRLFQGADAASARLAGTPDLSGGVDLRAQHRLLVSVDDRPPIPMDLWSASENRQAVTLSELRTALDAALGAGTASDDGKHLVLRSKTTGAGSSIEMRRMETRARRFVTRAYITDDPVQEIFGFLRQKATGQEATPGILQGKADLSRGVDLRQNRYLRIAVDQLGPKPIDCGRDARIPRSATLDEIVRAINTQIAAPVASHDGRHLTLTSLATGRRAFIGVEDPAPLPSLLGLASQYSGHDATDVFFEGTVDLSAGVDLSEADRIMIGADGGEPVEIACTGAHPTHTTLNEIVESINRALGAQVASRHGKHILLAATPRKNRSKLEFAVPPSGDATAAIFGFHPPRVYLGDPAAKAVGVGYNDLSKGVDLTVTPSLLRISVDGGPKVEIDCAKEAADPAHVRLDEIVSAINHALGAPVASGDNGHLVLTSLKRGKAASLVVETGPAPRSAHGALFGSPDESLQSGRDALPAVIRGQALKSTLDLTGAGVLRIVVDGAEPVDVDVAGERPDKTSLDEIVARINGALPGVASEEKGSIVLTSPTVGQPSSLEVLPRRALELIDYPPVPVTGPAHQVQHGSRFSVDNDGAADTGLEFEVTAPQGDSGVEFVDRATGARVRVMSVLRPGDKLSIGECGDTGLQAVITEPSGDLRVVPDSSILVGTLGAEAMVPFSGEWLLARGAGADRPPLLQLNDPSAPAIVVLNGLEEVQSDDRLLVQVTQAKATEGSPAPGVLFDVTIRLVTSRPTLTETYSSVTIGRGPTADSLILKILAAPSRIVRAQEIAKSDILNLALGRSEFTYMDCHEARFDHAWFPAVDPQAPQAEETRFAGGDCREWAVFDISRFSNAPPEQETAYFAPPAPLPDPPVNAAVNWTRFQPGAFVVNLPAELAEDFGSRFDQDRFGLPAGKPEQYNGVITEPATDRDYIVKRINAGSTLVTATAIPDDVPPPGFEVTTMPFLQPRSRTLSGGSATQSASIYLAENGVPGLIELRARIPGAWGNTIAVTSRQAGAVRFDMTIGYEGVRFENARLVALAGRILKPREDPLAQLAAQILKPGPVGVLQAKAAGVRADVTRDLTEIPPENSCRSQITGKT